VWVHRQHVDVGQGPARQHRHQPAGAQVFAHQEGRLPDDAGTGPVSPGPVTTPLHQKFGLSEEDRQKMAAGIVNQVPAGRFGEPVEIAKAVVFLASDESAFTVGSELIIDGGMSTL
jgi:enoyl-[acyl-carrier-protein] reductase (NADH)